jgi:pyruvate dehydrogenase E2 component (dihydrolipoamide acetyltransferase)
MSESSTVGVTPVRMPKWGLSMQEGAIVHWWKAEGDKIASGEDLVDIETSKITNVCESPGAGVLRRIVATPGETLPVGALIAVLAESSVSDAEVDHFITDFQSNFTPAAADEAEASALTLSMVEVGGQSIRVGRAGEGEGAPVVFIHGFGGDLNNWLFNVEPVMARAPVIAIDLPGHGGSSKAVGDGSLAALAGAVTGTLDALGAQRAHLVGHSLGAAVAARVAIDRPDLAASLTLIAPAHMPGGVVSKAFVSGLVEAERAKELKPLLEMLMANPDLVTKDMVEDMMKFKRLDGVEEALSKIRDRLLDGKDAAALQGDLAKIAQALVIASKQDRIVGAPQADGLPAGFRVEWIEGAGHMPHLEKSSEVNALLLAAIS